jgi:hypothetical protein
MNRETDTIFLQTIGRFIQAQIQLAVTPLMQTINEQADVIERLSNEKVSLAKELDGAIEGFSAEIARVENLMNDPGRNGKVVVDAKEGE